MHVANYYLRKSFLLIFLFSFFINCNAQSVFGIRGGAGVSSLQFEKGYESIPKPGLGINFGIEYLEKVNARLDFESGLFFRQKGQRIKESGTALSLTRVESNTPWPYIGKPVNKDEMLTYRLNYLYLPLCLNYKFNSSLFVSGGLYMAYGLKGLYIEKFTYTDEITNEVLEKRSVKTELLTKEPRYGFDGAKIFKRFDCGFILGVGYRFSRFCVRSDFDMGLLTSLKSSSSFLFYMNSNTTKFKNRSLSLSLVYYLSDDYYDIRF